MLQMSRRKHGSALGKFIVICAYINKYIYIYCILDVCTCIVGVGTSILGVWTCIEMSGLDF